jgi:hypothetical protein
MWEREERGIRLRRALPVMIFQQSAASISG